jgi:hypothetical protein
MLMRKTFRRSVPTHLIVLDAPRAVIKLAPSQADKPASDAANKLAPIATNA